MTRKKTANGDNLGDDETEVEEIIVAIKAIDGFSFSRMMFNSRVIRKKCDAY